MPALLPQVPGSGQGPFRLWSPQGPEVLASFPGGMMGIKGPGCLLPGVLQATPTTAGPWAWPAFAWDELGELW